MKDHDYKMVEAFQEMLNRDRWDLFVTITFKEKRGVDGAKKAFKSFFRNLNLPSEIFYEKFILSWVFYESEGSRRGVHVHALIKGIDPSLASLLEEKCKGFFGLSKVVPYNYNNSGSATSYLARKYPNINLVFFDYYKINSRLRMKREFCFISTRAS